ncbi:MAG: HU family DNA-binding protein [Ruminococcus sp.]|nr:HU family DNA-binding protein [Ruminococcus sp.]MCD7727425.1 HU family DNA-binding protein [Ruminococcus sp.]MCD7773901.1 HU family DNA-binding protein [Ruminococcus sp.]MCD8328206.1 HU family DNA-binding protein [Ruminococcus sp.]
MTKAEFVEAVALNGAFSKKDAEKAVKTVIDTITDSLIKGEKISLVGFGTFEVKERAARTALNPQTKEVVNVPAKKAVTFKAGKGLKDTIA